MPPPWEPECLCEADAILAIGWMFAAILITLVLMSLMVFFCYKTEEFEPALVIFLFSIVGGIISFSESKIPFTPYFQIFFMLFQTVLFILKALVYWESKRGY